MRCVIYARYSTERQSEASIADQVRVCREHAAAHGWPVASEHADEGISGAALGNRPGAQAAIQGLAQGDVLLVNDLSRLSRSQDLAPLLTMSADFWAGALVSAVIMGALWWISRRDE